MQVCQRERCDQTSGVCAYPSGACLNEPCGAGPNAYFCEPRPDTRFCGCDGAHYATVCDAWAAGTHVAACYAGCRLDGFQTCPAGTFCDVDAREYPGCPATETWGRCIALPGDCAGRPGEPACGCDGTVYANDCARVQAGQPRALDLRCGR